MTINQTVAKWLDSLSARLKGQPALLASGQWSGTNYIDSYKRNRTPTPNELMAELKSVAFTCATINAAACASYAPLLYAVTNDGDPELLFPTHSIPLIRQKELKRRPGLQHRTARAKTIQVVDTHPMMDLLNNVNDFHNAYDLWELTTLYQEVHGSAYWFLDMGPLGTPSNIWLLPSQNVTPKRRPHSENIVDYYEYRTGASAEEYSPNQIIHFRYPDPKDPYTSGLSPLRAVFEQVATMSDYAAFKRAKFENRAIPDAVISPDEVIGEEERERLEAQWNQKFRRGGAGRVVVAESGLKVQLLSQSMGDLANLADMRATKEDITNAFHVPISFFTTNTNLANLLASQGQHMAQCITPRLMRRDEKLNSQLVPLFDQSGRLFLASEDPTPVDANLSLQAQQNDMRYGVVSINEIRAERGLPPAEWGDKPWLPLNWAPTDLPNRPQYAPHESTPRVGRARDVEDDNNSPTQGGTNP